MEGRYQRAFDVRKKAAYAVPAQPGSAQAIASFRDAQKNFDRTRGRTDLAEKAVGTKYNDTNYIFLSFVTRYLPAGLVGLIIAVIFAAAMSSSSGEINSLATVTVMDLYQRHMRQEAPDRHYLQFPASLPRSGDVTP